MPARMWFAYCLTFLVAFLGFDYFSAKKLNLPISAEKFNQYFSLAYPHCMSERTCIWNFVPDPETDAQSLKESRPVSVILWTDVGLKRDKDVVWPIPMETHAAALDSILRYKPKAVFVDILFVDDPAKRGDHSIEDLVDTINGYEDDGVPIYFSDPNSPTMSVVEPLANALGKDGLIPVMLNSNSTQITYPAEVRTPSGESRANGAVAIYRKNTEPKEGTNSGDLHLFWGGHTSEINKKVWNCYQFGMPETFHGILSRALREIIKPVSVSDDASTEPRPDAGSIACPYTPVLPADIFVDIPACTPDPAQVNSLCFRRTENFLKANIPKIKIGDVRTVITGKYIFYGASFEGASDIHRVPIYDHKGLSGVFVHAMALDNLIEMDGRVPKAQTGRTIREAALYYVFSLPLSVFSFVISGYLIFSVWHSVEGRMSILIERVALRVLNWRRRERASVGNLEVIIHKLTRFLSLLIEILYHGLVIVFIGGVILFCTWLVFTKSTIGVINWTAILLSSGVLSIWTKTPFAEALVDILFRKPSSDRRIG